jgi:hypothetical protein
MLIYAPPGHSDYKKYLVLYLLHRIGDYHLKLFFNFILKYLLFTTGIS